MNLEPLIVQGFTLLINTLNKNEGEERKKRSITLTQHKKTNCVKKQVAEKDCS